MRRPGERRSPLGKDARQPGFAAWLRTARGVRLLDAERPSLHAAARRFHGDVLLWVGVAPQLLDITSQCMVRARVFAFDQPMPAAKVGDGARDVAFVATDPARLPFATGDVAGIVLHHALETAADPRAALREAARVLRVGGRLVVAGFNPFSPWLFAKALPAFRRLRLVGVPRLRDWLALLGLEPDVRPTYLAPSVWTIGKSRRAGSGPPTVRGGPPRWWRRLPIGAVYLVVATKTAPGLVVEPERRKATADMVASLPNATAFSRRAA